MEPYKWHKRKNTVAGEEVKKNKWDQMERKKGTEWIMERKNKKGTELIY